MRGSKILLITFALLLFASACRQVKVAGTGVPVESNSATPIPFVVSAWSMSSPSNSSTSLDSTPQLQASVNQGGTVNVYLTSDCSGGALATVNPGASGTINFTTIDFGTSYGTKTFYYDGTGANGQTAACAATSLSYTFVEQRISFAKNFMTVKESDGSVVQDSIVVSRNAGGATGSVTLKYREVTARSGTNFTAGSTTVNFAYADTSITVPVGTFTVVSEANETGDLAFALKLQSPNAGVLEPFRSHAMVNVIDGQLTTGDYFFGHTFYTAMDGTNVVTLHVQRTGDTASARTITIDLVDGTAVNGTDYGTGVSSTTVNFGIGDVEKEVNIAISDVGSNKSFFAKIRPSTSYTVRAQSIAKVRILNEASLSATGVYTGCNTAGAPFGGGAGTAGNPYLICTRTQLAAVDANGSNHFKMMADIDVDPADGAFTKIAATLDGDFDGNEFTILNFTVSAGAATAGLITTLHGGAAAVREVRNLNVLYASVVNGNLPAAIWCAQASGARVFQANHVFAHGYVSTANLFGGIGGNVNSTGSNVSYSNSYILTAGRFVTSHTGTSAAGGVFAGLTPVGGAVTNLDFSFDYVFSTATVSGHSHVGQIIGTFGSNASQPYSVRDLDYIDTRGLVLCRSSFCGSIIGSVSPNVSYFNLSLTHSTSASKVQASDLVTSISNIYMGGLVGFAATETWNLSNNSFYGIVNSPTSGAGTRSATGGLFGYVANINGAGNNKTMVMDGNAFNGQLTGITAVGGIAGQIVYTGTGTNVDLTVMNSTSTGTITSTGNYSSPVVAYISVTYSNTTVGNDSVIWLKDNTPSATLSGLSYVGGVLGYLSGSGSGRVTYLMESNTVTATLSGSGSTFGGIAGQIDMHTNRTITVQNNTFDGSLSSTTGNTAGGIVGLIFRTIASSDASATIYNNINESDVNLSAAGATYVGGIVGQVRNSSTIGTNLSFTISSNTNNGAITGANGVAGVLGYYNHSPTAGSSNNVYTIANNLNTGLITGNVSGNNGTGGILSRGLMTTTIAEMHVTGNKNQGNISCPNGMAYAGGVIAILSLPDTTGSSIEFTRNVNSGHISVLTTNNNIGGLIGSIGTGTGNAASVITESYNSGNITGGVGAKAGLVGSLSGTTLSLSDNYATGTIASGGSAAGLINNCATVGVPVNRNYFAGLLPNGATPLASANATKTDCYWLRDVGLNDNLGADGNNRTVAQMETQATYNNYDFVTIWSAPSAGVYPDLINAP